MRNISLTSQATAESIKRKRVAADTNNIKRVLFCFCNIFSILPLLLWRDCRHFTAILSTTLKAFVRDSCRRVISHCRPSVSGAKSIEPFEKTKKACKFSHKVNARRIKRENYQLRDSNKRQRDLS